MERAQKLERELGCSSVPLPSKRKASGSILSTAKTNQPNKQAKSNEHTNKTPQNLERVKEEEDGVSCVVS